MTEDQESKAVVQRGYDKIAQTYLEWTANHESPRVAYLEKLLARLPHHSTASVLELGCGAGVPGTQVLAANFHQVVANDISDAQVALARTTVQKPNVEYLAGDMTKLSFAPSTFDAVVGFYSIIHLPKQEQHELFKQIRAWLKPGGYLLCNLSTTEDPGGTRTWLDGSEMYWSSFDAEEYLRILANCGFGPIDSEILDDDEDGKVTPFLWILASKRDGDVAA